MEVFAGLKGHYSVLNKEVSKQPSDRKQSFSPELEWSVWRRPLWTFCSLLQNISLGYSSSLHCIRRKILFVFIDVLNLLPSAKLLSWGMPYNASYCVLSCETFCLPTHSCWMTYCLCWPGPTFTKWRRNGYKQYVFIMTTRHTEICTDTPFGRCQPSVDYISPASTCSMCRSCLVSWQATHITAKCCICWAKSDVSSTDWTSWVIKWCRHWLDKCLKGNRQGG